MSKEKNIDKVEDPVMMVVNGSDGNSRSWKKSECNEHQLKLIEELKPISEALLELENNFARINRDKQYRIDDFVAACNEEEVVVDNPEQNPNKPEEK